MSKSVDGMEGERECDKGFYSDFCGHGERSKGCDHGGNVEMPPEKGRGEVRRAKDVDPYKLVSATTNRANSKRGVILERQFSERCRKWIGRMGGTSRENSASNSVKTTENPWNLRLINR
jgi:hypothetical protein